MLASFLVSLPFLAGLIHAAAVPVTRTVVEEITSSNVTVSNDITIETLATTSAVTVLTTDQLASYAPYTQFARAAYCASSKVSNWGCGAACRALPGFKPTLTGGDGNDVQLYFVGYWPQRNSVVITHQGTDPTQFLSVLTDIDIFQKTLDSTLFLGLPSGIAVHGGFADSHAKTAATILAETKRLISMKGANAVTLIGHSLGGALAELDALYMKLNLPSNIHIKAVTYGTPRVGNPAFATYLDSRVPDFQRINNERDPIPIVPGRGLGFQHPHGEIHIVSPGHAVSCTGNDATDAQCTIATVPNVFDGNIFDHLGPYEGISIGTIFCT